MTTMAPLPRVAVVGAGIAGLATAWHLAGAGRGPAQADVVLFESDARAGGHAHTVDVSIEGITHGVDTGFLVFNRATYPQLLALFDALGVATAPSDMSFSVQLPDSGLEWSGSSLDTVFAQRRNLLRPGFLRMLADLLRFNRLTTRIAERLDAGEPADELRGISIGDFLVSHRFGSDFRDGYLLPMLGCIWSCPTRQMLQFPVLTMIRFCHNHGLIRITDRPQWYTVAGGSREYVRRLLSRLPNVRLGTPVTAVRRVPPGRGSAGIWLEAGGRVERFDEVVLACHSDQILGLLGDGASADERRVLGAIRYQPNRAVLHTDASLLPRRRKAWAAWNYERSSRPAQEQQRVCLHYLINRLQPLPWRTPVIVSLNPTREPDPARVQGEFVYAHPVFDQGAIEAQQQLPEIQGRAHVWFAGAWTRYGFHEDGLRSAQEVVAGLLARWQRQDAAGTEEQAA